MTNQDNKTPALNKQTFICPYCNDRTQQIWERWKYHNSNGSALASNLYLKTAECIICLRYSIWRGPEMIYPLASLAPPPDNNMPDPVKITYEEARSVSIYSSRAAAALLRVALEELTAQLGETEDTLYKQIRRLYKRDFPEEVIQMFDIVRITANKGGAHSGEIDLTGKDGAEVVNTLFFLVNHIVEIAITTSKKIKQEYEKIPQELREQIAKDDKPKET